MPLPMPRSPHPDASAGSANAAPSWAADGAEADPTPGPAAPATAQMTLFDANGVAPTGALHARLRGRIKALVARRRSTLPPSPTVGPPASSWPDSFFDVDAKP
jgi:hypothetical protein